MPRGFRENLSSHECAGDVITWAWGSCKRQAAARSGLCLCPWLYQHREGCRLIHSRAHLESFLLLRSWPEVVLIANSAGELEHKVSIFFCWNYTIHRFAPHTAPSLQQFLIRKFQLHLFLLRSFLRQFSSIYMDLSWKVWSMICMQVLHKWTYKTTSPKVILFYNGHHQQISFFRCSLLWLFSFASFDLTSTLTRCTYARTSPGCISKLQKLLVLTIFSARRSSNSFILYGKNSFLFCPIVAKTFLSSDLFCAQTQLVHAESCVSSFLWSLV